MTQLDLTLKVSFLRFLKVVVRMMPLRSLKSLARLKKPHLKEDLKSEQHGKLLLESHT